MPRSDPLCNLLSDDILSLEIVHIYCGKISIPVFFYEGTHLLICYHFYYLRVTKFQILSN